MKKILFAAFVLAAALPMSASAQSSLDVAQAQSYLGTWEKDLVVNDFSGSLFDSVAVDTCL